MDGVDDHINLGDGVADGLRTIDFWFRPRTNINTQTDPQGLVYRWNISSNSNNVGVYIGGSSLGDNGKLVFQRNTGSTNRKVVSDASAWTAGRWYHVVGTIDPTSGMKMYVDGVLQQNTNTSTAAATSTTHNVHVGRWGAFNGRYFNGEIDELKLWSRALDTSEVMGSKCDTIIPFQQTGLLGYWDFNDDMDTTTAGYNDNNTLILGDLQGANLIQDASVYH